MPARKIHSSELPEKMFGLDIPTSLFAMGQSMDGTTYYAYRNGSPVFAISGDSPTDVYKEATETIERFLAKMNRYGFLI